ncbi:uncharacterized protein HMPREF1541_01890 [Cyphellophora europaea CBS 101466]|uniref:Transcription initiation factor TFIID subunit 2 n=1 Tax=Cyphellophora europaea (strain CBS 101466) TaxID=1220924 RepID=W2S224_CYPE1|nr:uncharacterized protein HMPREF1541_01890 [Cyphellophora europaea CBS 101466]ETN42732.1 hypothetical protein HMPREF1541_01890 [Cyphellophora europaea CBS 101466]
MTSSTTQTVDSHAADPFAETRFSLFHTKVDLDLNFGQNITGHTEIEIHPESKSFKYIYLNAQQCSVSNVTVNGIEATHYHQDPCVLTKLHFEATAHQHHFFADKIDRLRGKTVRPNLVIQVPSSIRITEVNETEVRTQDAGTIRVPQPAGTDATETARGLTDTSVAKFTPLVVSINFTTIHMHDAVEFVSGPRGSGRWPHAFTRGRQGGASAATLFPCSDSLYVRGTWEIAITTPQTVGDALKQTLAENLGDVSPDKKANGAAPPAHETKQMLVLCSGEFVNDVISKTDPTKKTTQFIIMEKISAQQIGFAVGPFERVDLNVFRDAEDQDKLGDNAVQMYGYCLPHRSEEVMNTCLPTPKAMDTFVQKYSASPFQPYSMVFVEDMPHDVSIFAGLSVCSTRLLYPEGVIDSAQHSTRRLVHAIAAQWLGINVIPETPFDAWVVVGMAHFLTDLFMKDICGMNEYRARMYEQANQIYEQDKERPSIYDMGDILHVDPSAYEFLALKAPVVLFILDRRMAKTAGATKMPGIISKILTRARTGDLDNNALSTDFFQKTTERINHGPINDFMQQWVKGAGCPHFRITQRFNKKKLMIEMFFDQLQSASERELDSSTFMRDVREDWNEVYAGERQNVFTGPMTIRIHEADGTPYEHIVQIKEGRAQIDVPYNTKYKRLKRTRKQRNKAATKAAEEDDDEKDTLVYYLGDNLQTEEELEAWRLVDWSQEMENAMALESFEWIRADADFEWIARIELLLPGYMYASQLQQDRDIVSQLHAVRSIAAYKADSMASSILLRTLMDKRYFHRVRHIAAQGLVLHADRTNDETRMLVDVGKFHLKKAFEELFCSTDSGTSIIRPNDFSDHQQYLAQLAIVEAVSKIRDDNGYTPRDIKEWMLDKLKFNDNSNNEFSDAFYVSTLMKGLAKALIAKPLSAPDVDAMDLDQTREYADLQQFEQACVEEIDRYRRMDEWTSSYQNLYSRTALECQAILANAGIHRYSPLHFLQYTRPGNYDMLRLAAFEVLVDPRIFEMSSVLKYVIHCTVADSSPLIRQELQKAFGEIIGRRAIGDRGQAIVIEKQAGSDDLVVEEGADKSATRAEEIARRTSIDAALLALKKELGENAILKKAVWDAVSYSEITIDDLATMLDFCRMLYPPKDEMKVKLQLPRYWQVQHLGKVWNIGLFLISPFFIVYMRSPANKACFQGKLKFSHTNKVRTKLVPRWQPPKRAVDAHPPPPMRTGTGSLKLKIRPPSQANISAPGLQSARTPVQTPTPPPPPVRQVQQEAPPQKKITLKLGLKSGSPTV